MSGMRSFQMFLAFCLAAVMRKTFNVDDLHDVALQGPSPRGCVLHWSMASALGIPGINLHCSSWEEVGKDSVACVSFFSRWTNECN